MSKKSGITSFALHLTVPFFICEVTWIIIQTASKMLLYWSHQRNVILLLQVIEAHLQKQGFTKLIIKPIPLLYYPRLYQATEFALTFSGYSCYRRDVATLIELDSRGKIPKGRKSSIKKALREGVSVSESTDFETFFKLENENLQKKYNTTAVHTAEEMENLHLKHPDNIRLFLAHHQDSLLAGAIIFINRKVCHLQYLAMNEKGESLSATDLLLNNLIQTSQENNLERFDFGISTENDGKYLNEGLNKYKESFGGASTLYEFYEKQLHA